MCNNKHIDSKDSFLNWCYSKCYIGNSKGMEK